MKRNYMIRLVLLLLAVISGQSMKAQTFSGGKGTETDPYQIASLGDWNTLAYAIVGNSDQAANDFAGKYFKMTADIGTIANPVKIPLGKQVGPDKKTDRKRFAGHFDGNHKTLTVDINNENDNDWFYYNASYCAPFAYAQNITIKDLTVVGTITTTGQFASGLVGQTGPDNKTDLGTCTIEHCHVAATFVGNTGSGANGNHGIFISVAEGNVTITNSWFDGEITGSNYYYSGGFIGLNKATATLTDCLFNPSSITVTPANYKLSSEFSHDIGGTSKLTRCYYTKSFSDPETAQGQRVRTGAAPEANDYYSVYTNDIKDENGIPRPTPDGYNYYIIMENYIWTKIQTENIDAGVDSYSLANVDESRLVDGKLVAGKDNTAFVVPAGKTFTLNLGGRTIDRELDVVNPALTNGYIIKVEAGAKLTVTNGTIQHGHNKSNGGCIYNEGELILDHITLTKNYADGNGNGAGIYNAGTLSLNEVTITDNHLKSDGTGTGAGVYNTSDASLHISGKVLITGNKKGTQENNLFLAGSSVITVDAAITDSKIGIMKNTEGVFTEGLVSHSGKVGNFQNDDSNNYFIVIEDGEAKWLVPALFEIKEGEANAANITSMEGYRANVQLTGRTLYKDGDWNTICLPFDCKVTDSNCPLYGDGVEARELKNASYNSETNTLSLTFQTVTNLVAGKPYLIKWTSGSEDLFEPTFNKVTIKSAMKNSNANNITFIGLYDPVTFTDDPSVLFLGTQNKLYYPGTKPRTIGVCRGYFQLSGIDASGVKAYELSFEDEDDPTSIKTVYTVQNPMNDAIYNLAGQRISKMQKGINIVNGKKVIIK